MTKENIVNTNSRKIRNAIIFFVISLIFVIFYSISTSPLYSTYGVDSAVFQTIGKYWAEDGVRSLIPYLDMFDHKGPLIYLIDAFGYHLTGDKNGILFIQVITIFIFCLCIYKIGRIELLERRAIFWTLINLFFLASCYEDGNMTEEYALPFIAYSLYCIYRYVGNCRTVSMNKKTVYDHRPRCAVVYGLTFGVCLMTRVTNALSVCIGVLVITSVLVLARKWKNLLHNVIGFLTGILLIVVPFMIYFGLHGAVYDFWYGTLLYNLDYVSASSWIWKQDVSYIKLMAYVIYILYSCIPMAITGIISLHKKMYAKGVFMLLTGLSSMLYLISSNTYRHYSIIMIPYFMLIICEIIKLNSAIVNKYILTLLFVLTLGSSMASTGIMIISNIKQENKGYEELLAYVPDTEIESVIGYNMPSSMYLEYDIAPYYAYFHHQDWMGEKSSTLMKKIRTTFLEGNVKWILVKGDFVGIQDILDSKYIHIKSYSDGSSIEKLFRRKANEE